MAMVVHHWRVSCHHALIRANHVEGIATCAAAVVAYFILPDFPATTKWLTPEEKEIALARLRADDLGSDDGTEQGHWKSLKACFTDWRTYVSRTIRLC